MSKFHAALIAAFLLAPAVAYAAEDEKAPPKLSAADIKKNLEAATSDPAKVKAYCAMSKKMDEVGDDEKKAEAAGNEIDGYFKTLGEDFENAWDSGQDAADGSPEAKAMDEAIAGLDAKCK
ncbi:hypothetical protein [Hyphomicrobium sp.]|jgi:hypothetical protein|uniref:hypothetical protein n=1 Tax=Hyphomicrobium sp. TaxID=82 RepID=UPI000FB14884|nr:hypothetical protein [Hyphomicrobium sp.]RUO97807.1 MAG: hypothetical protein EKK30_13795 [Hyphomicrobium sp.]